MLCSGYDNKLYLTVKLSVWRVECSFITVTPRASISTERLFVLFWFGLFLWHINHCWLFNAKSIFIYKIVLFQTIQFSISTQVSSVWLIVLFDPSGATTTDQRGSGGDVREGLLRILQSSSITVTSPSDCLVSYPKHSLGRGLSSQQKCSRCILKPQPTG